MYEIVAWLRLLFGLGGMPHAADVSLPLGVVILSGQPALWQVGFCLHREEPILSLYCYLSNFMLIVVVHFHNV